MDTDPEEKKKQEDRLTTVAVRLSVKQRLDVFRVGDESYNSAIRRLLQLQEK